MDPTHTPDTSGYANTGTLQASAQFPQEYAGNGTDQYLGWYPSDPVDPDRNYLDANNNPEVVTNCTKSNLRGTTVNLCIKGHDIPIGVSGQGIYMGDDGRVIVNASPSLDSLTTAMTASFFVKRLRAIGVGRALLTRPGSYQITIDVEGHIRANLFSPSGFQSSPPTTAIVPLNTWTHVAMTFTASTGLMTLYINGKKDVTYQAAAMPISAPTGVLFIGPAISGSTIANPTVPYLIFDEVSLSNIARSAAAIQSDAFVQATYPVGGYAADKLTLPPGLAGAPIPILNASALTPKIVALGQKLFSDPILSADKTRSCATCHLPSLAFTDGNPISLGSDGQPLTRNAPTLVNRLMSTAQMWDGRAASLEDQVWLPISAPRELGFSKAGAVARVQADPGYVAQFEAAFGADPSAETLAAALAAFERTILSADSPYDQGQLSATAQHGQILFFGAAACVSCHRGPNFTDERFHNNGLQAVTDLGVGALTGLATDLGVFKTPSLRNLSATGPYLHNGAIGDLKSIVQLYNAGGLAGVQNKDREIFPLGLSDSDLNDLVDFLKSLTGSVSFGIGNLR